MLNRRVRAPGVCPESPTLYAPASRTGGDGLPFDRRRRHGTPRSPRLASAPPVLWSPEFLLARLLDVPRPSPLRRAQAAAEDPELLASVRGHGRRVGRYARVLGAQLGLSAAAAWRLAAASTLHDVGHLALPAALLRKAGPLTASEWKVVHRHTWLGAAAFQGLRHPLFEAAREIALSHHERWDGSGYPLGLAGEDIPLAGRIVALADQYDALRSRRPYKAPLGHVDTCAVLMEGDGRTRPEHFDPLVLAAFRGVTEQFAALACD